MAKYFTIIFIALFFINNGIKSQITFDNGDGDNKWHNAGNWDSGTIPESTDNVVIPTGLSVEISSPTTDAECQNLTINGTGALTIETPYKKLILSGDLDLNGTINVNSANQCAVGTTSTSSLGTHDNELSDYPFPQWPSNRTQIIIRKSELTSMLGTNENINALGFYIDQINSGYIDDAIIDNLSIKIGHTGSAEGEISGGSFVTPAFTEVLYESVYTLTNGGWNTFTFQYGFQWNGTDDIVVDITYSETDNGYTVEAWVDESIGWFATATDIDFDDSYAIRYSDRPVLRLSSCEDEDFSAQYGNIDAAEHWDATGGTFNPSGGTVTFNGTAQQNLTSDGNNFSSVTINKNADATTTAGQVVLQDNLTINNTLTLTRGIFKTGANTLIVNNTDPNKVIISTPDASNSDNSWVSGNFRHYITQGTNSQYAFPVGTDTKYHLAEIVGNSLTFDAASYITASFSAGDPGFTAMSSTGGCDDDGDPYTGINTTGMWSITPSNSIASGTYDLKCFIVNFSGLTNEQFGIISRSNGGGNSDWCAVGNIVVHDATDNYAERTDVDSFSEKGIGTSDAPLPVSLIDFSANCNANNVILKWQTATEINNDYFVILKSFDLQNWDSIGSISGNGNSNTIKNYEYTTDLNTVETYYRLKQVDYDGSAYYLPIKALNCTADNIVIKNIFPQPAKNYFQILLYSPKDMHCNINITNALGEKLFTQSINLQEGESRHTIVLNKKLPAGVYLLQVSSTDLKNIVFKNIIIN